MTETISSVDADEILDSRGQPTLSVTVRLANGMHGTALVPSGASTGEFEARELRDEDPRRYGGKGVLRAVRSVREEIAPRLRGRAVDDQSQIDRLMIDLDGTPDKRRLGANAVVGVSMAVARAGAKLMKLPLFTYLGGLDGTRLPVPMMNVINGGKHAANGLAFQEFMIVPHGAPTFAEALRYGAQTYAALRRELERRGYPTSVGDEGGFAPELASEKEACQLILAAIDSAGFTPGEQVSIALDPAASSFSVAGGYRVPSLGNAPLTSEDLLEVYADWLAEFPIVSIEDGFDEKDWAGFQRQTARMGDRIQIVGDDLYVTNTKFIRRGIDERATNAVLIKLNQIGTVTETIDAIKLCRSAGWRYVISHRSGETEDTFIADFAVAMGGGQIKAGSVCRSERLAKYNRLLRIERELGTNATYASPFGVSVADSKSVEAGRSIG